MSKRTYYVYVLASDFGWRRSKKASLIESLNPAWRDLAEDLSDPSLRSG